MNIDNYEKFCSIGKRMLMNLSLEGEIGTRVRFLVVVVLPFRGRNKGMIVCLWEISSKEEND